MPHSSPKFILEQIYNFVVEMPDISSKSHFMQLNIFFKELHESDTIEYEALKPNNYKGVFNGRTQTIAAHGAPSLLNKNDFLEWVVKIIN